MKRLICLAIFLFHGTFYSQVFEGKRFVVVIPSYHNAEWYQKNLDSVFNQDYSNWRVIYIDDCSKDGTGDLVERYIQKKGFEDKVLLIKNRERFFALANFYRAIQLCDYNEIIVTLDGDDWLAHNRVLSDLNELYQDPNIWLTYGSYEEWPPLPPAAHQAVLKKFDGHYGNRPVPQRVIENNEFRTFVGCTGQLRSFYAWLFKSIRLEDFIYKGDFLPMPYDVAIMLPMAEMCGGKFRFIPETNYIHNVKTPLNDHKVDIGLQGRLARFIRQKSVYKPLSESREYYFRSLSKEKADVIIFSDDAPEKLARVLEMVRNKFHAIGSCCVIYQAYDEKSKKAYEFLQDSTDFVKFIEPDNNYKSSILETLDSFGSNYIFSVTDESMFNRGIDVNNCITLLEETQAYAFYLNPYSAQKQKPRMHIRDHVWAYQCAYKQDDLFDFDFALYRKQDFYNLVFSLDFDSQQSLQANCRKQIPSNKIMLFTDYEYSAAL